jgi:hypothetical protein
VPEWKDYASWLFLAQHHGVPTRLLDWTENVLVGLYFAVGEHEKSGELWCMHHSELNRRSADWKACFADSPPIRYLAAAAFLEADSDEIAELKAALGPTNVGGPLALIPPQRFPRISAQMSRFTIHPSTESEQRIEFLLRGVSLVRYIIPSECKASLARNLRQIGFSHESLYRSLDSLALSIKEEIVEPDFDISPPPRFDPGPAAP